jgi:signal transduction histidine kinase
MTRRTGAPRTWVWLQLLLGWLPVWALYTLMVSSANPIHGGTPTGHAVLSGLIAVGIAALLGLLVQRITERVPWAHPVRPGFLAVHLSAAAVYSALWVVLKFGVESLIRPQSMMSFHFLLLPNFILGVWLYVMVAGISYAVQASQRVALAEASAARSQLAALRGQLNPHFLFNALHTVVHLIPRDPSGAARAAEQIAGLLRTTLEEDRDIVTLAQERAFVERYLELERIRFGDRLRVSIRTSEDAGAALLPSFALQTLVENAVRHGAAPRVEPTKIVVEGRVSGKMLTLTVRDSGDGMAPGPEGANGGTGLQRLRERLAALYGSSAQLTLETGATGGCTASLSIPQTHYDGGA